jgi:hypothetical protein
MKKDIETEINDFLAYFDCQKMINFLRDIIPLFELYDVDQEDDWVKNVVGEGNTRNVRLIRTVYLVSRIAEFHAGKLCTIKAKHPQLWKRLEKITIKH